MGPQRRIKMVKSWKESGEMSPGEKAVEEEGKRRVKEVTDARIEESKRNAQVKPTRPTPLRNESSE
jgi:hypothetical protein